MITDNLKSWLNNLFSSERVTTNADGIKTVTLDTLTSDIDSGVVLFDEPEKIEENTTVNHNIDDILTRLTAIENMDLLHRLERLESAIEITDSLVDEKEIIEI